ncbi:peptidase inhibitor family I36 protein [Saccharothrix sp. NPDC042600]|uniref:peptidase inhibitor family I36 protein n=1 Tax=Saccharothrix TaxID=2071 RepID=UPI0033C9E731|nr:hypothetical protein GCM10017745_50150 [Saccharothrix mutabilis subsp. capreolus]
MKRLFSTVAAMLMLAVMTVGTASATPANTGPGAEAWWDCPDGYFCAWYYEDGADRGSDGKPDFYGRVGAPDLREFGLNDHVWSVWNRTGEVWCTYPDINYADLNGGTSPNPWAVGNWRGNTRQYNMQNVISSLRRGSC